MKYLGKKVRCKMSGLTGIATGFSRFLNGHTNILIQPEVGQDGAYREEKWVMAAFIEPVREAPKADKKAQARK